MARGAARLGLGFLLAALASAACFSPKEPACAFSCAADGECPTSYTCGSDGLCHREDGQGVCLLAPVNVDAEADADAGQD
jgi:hypothetical protein